MQAVPIVPSATVQTTVRQLPRNTELPATTIAKAGNQNTAQALRELERISRDLQVALSDFTEFIYFAAASAL